MERNELEVICKEILALNGVTLVMFWNRDGEIVCMESKVEPESWIMPKDMIERKTCTLGQMLYEIAGELSKYAGRLDAIALVHEKRNSFIIPFDELFLGITTNKKVDVSIIKKLKKIIKKHRRR